MRPTAADILAMIEKLEDGMHLTPEEEGFPYLIPDDDPIYWDCRLLDSNGAEVGQGQAKTEIEAAVLAWIHHWAPNGLIDCDGLDQVPLVVPSTWRFKLRHSLSLEILEENMRRRIIMEENERRWREES